MKVNCPYIKQEKLEKEYDVDFAEIINDFLKGENLEMSCSKCNKNTITSIQYYIKEFPKYLIMPIQRFILDNWVPTKIQAYIKNCEKLDLNKFIMPEPNPNETLIEGFYNNLIFFYDIFTLSVLTST